MVEGALEVLFLKRRKVLLFQHHFFDVRSEGRGGSVRGKGHSIQRCKNAVLTEANVLQVPSIGENLSIESGFPDSVFSLRTLIGCYNKR